MSSAQVGFDTTESEETIREIARDIATNYDQDYWMEVNGPEKRRPTEYWQDCADAGLLGTTVPEEFGGQGLGMSELMAAVEELVKNGCFGTEMLFVVNVIFGGVTLTQHGSREQKEAYLEPLVEGDLHFCMALTEPNAGHNAPEMETHAEQVEDNIYRINGPKQWISGIDRADKMLLVARTTPLEEVSKRTMGVSLFLADPEDDAIDIRQLETGIPHPENSFELDLHDYEATEDDIIGTKGMGLYQLFDTVNPERLVTSAGGIGLGRCALNQAIDYASDREVFDQPIGSHQAVQHPIADAWSKLEAAEQLVKKAAWMMDEGKDRRDTAEISNMAKLRATEAAYEATDQAVQTHGGKGFLRKHGVVEMWKGSRLARVAPGSTEMMLNDIAEHTLDLPRSY